MFQPCNQSKIQNPNTLKEETRLLENLIPLSQQLHELAPWQWMYESELFGVEPPGSDAPYFASIMGSAGQFTAFSFYEGANAADQFLFIQEAEIGSNPNDILLIPHLMVSFEPFEHLQPEDRKRIQNLGYSPGNNKQWPVLLQYKPGHPPVFPELQKLRDLVPLLEQTLNTAEHAKNEGLNFIARTADGIRGMIRTMDPETNTWRTENRSIPTRYKSADIRFSKQLAARLKQIPPKDVVLETDLLLMPMPIADRDPEYFPFAFLLIDQQSGYIVQCEMISPHPSVDEMFASCGQLLLKILTRQNIRPLRIHVRSWRLHLVLKKVLSGTPVRLSLVPELPAVDEAQESLLNYFSSNTQP